MARWLFKSEPQVYGWDDLVHDGRTAWTGVRNHSAAINLRAMAIGDTGLFYHSNTGKACVGIVRVVATHYPDPTDPTARFPAVDIAPLEPLHRAVTLAAIKAEPALAQMDLVRLSRLSVAAVREEEWATILAMARA